MRARRHLKRGQATTEYILIVVLVAVLSIGVITAFGNQLRDLYRLAAERLGGIGDSQLNEDITKEAEHHVDLRLRDLRK